MEPPRIKSWGFCFLQKIVLYFLKKQTHMEKEIQLTEKLLELFERRAIIKLEKAANQSTTNATTYL